MSVWTQPLSRTQLVRDLGRRFRPDYHSEAHKLVVEFDGDQHYRSTRVILGDVERDAFFTENGFCVIRIPYFVQLSRAVIAHLFRDIANTTSDFLNFPHGFIAPTVVMPADFCELGIARFEDDLKRFGYIAGDILQSLREAAAARRDWRTVYPPSRYEKWDIQSAMPSTKPLPQQCAAPLGLAGFLTLVQLPTRPLP